MILYFKESKRNQVTKHCRSKNVVLVSAAEQWTQLDAYINNSDYLNSSWSIQRNAARTPWNHQVDIKIIYETKFHKISCSLLLIFLTSEFSES
jgi:hypothetical protein